MNPKQLPLVFQLNEFATFANYVVERNPEVVNILRNLATGDRQWFVVYIWGGAGSGKSHLLQAVCQLAAERELTPAYLPLAEVVSTSPRVMENLESLDLVCIDDIDVIAGNKLWEEALFDLFNRMRAANKPMVICGSKNISELNLKLPDLSSRMAWGLVYRLYPLSDDSKIDLLKERAARRGFELSTAVAQYLLRNFPRDLTTLVNLLETLDYASLAEQRRITIAFVREWLHRVAPDAAVEEE
jgi:DnaA family protein